MTMRSVAKTIKFMELPRIVAMGPGCINNIGEICEQLELQGRALLVCDKVTWQCAGLKVKQTLETKKTDCEKILISASDIQTVRVVETHVRKKGCNFIIGIGGGRPIDVAKFAAFECGIPFISAPTAASHDGIASSRASIKIRHSKSSVPAQSPIAIVADTKIIASAPFRLLAAGCGDIIAKRTAVRDWQLARRLKNEDYSSYAAALSEMTASLLIENADIIKPNLEEAARFVVKSLVSSGVAMSIAGSSRPASGSEHMFSHALDIVAKKPALHGEQCGIGTIMMMYLHGGDWGLIKDTLIKIGAPTNARELGVTNEEIIKALTLAHKIRPERYTILGDKGLTAEAAEKLARVTGVIV